LALRLRLYRQEKRLLSFMMHVPIFYFMT